MALTPDEQKSVAYSQQERRRAAFQRSMQARLKAPAGPAQRVLENFRPLIGRRKS